MSHRNGAAEQAFTLLFARAADDAPADARGREAERVARAEAERLAQARADILAIVAHDLRNPLNVIASAVQLLLAEAPSPDQQRRVLRMTQRAATQMKRLIGDLLEATRLEAGRLTLDLADVDVSEIARDAEETFRHAAAARRVHLAVQAPGRDWFVRADAGRVQQAIGNLIANALKFTDAGGRVIASAEAADGEIVFRVADTGPGIDPLHQPHLFDRFWQARNGDRRGVGLGLAIAKGIIDAHGGRIWVESAPGAGATFSFALPRSTPSMPAVAAPDGASRPLAGVEIAAD
jgi:signal transduction histidine kinase